MHAHMDSLYTALRAPPLIVANCIILAVPEMFACKNNVVDSAPTVGMGIATPHRRADGYHPGRGAGQAHLAGLAALL